VLKKNAGGGGGLIKQRGNNKGKYGTSFALSPNNIIGMHTLQHTEIKYEQNKE
jgi:hypothetical protein